jgi:hypothetical protein
MSLNRYEQAVFDYWEQHTDERRHWQAKVTELTRAAVPAGELARALERELWDYLVERSQHVPVLRDLRLEGVRRVSLLNLADHVIRLWGPPPQLRRPAAPF